MNTIDWNDMNELYDFAEAVRDNPTPERIAELDAHMPEWVSVEDDWSEYGDIVRCIHAIRDTIKV